MTRFDADGQVVDRWVLDGPGHPDLVTVDVIARLALAAAREGGRLGLAEVTPALRELLDLTGLGVEMERQPERREQTLGIEEG